MTQEEYWSSRRTTATLTLLLAALCDGLRSVMSQSAEFPLASTQSSRLSESLYAPH